ncbi:protein kinase domain-containing protein [Stieleria varia]|nr:protein kinase [Stieleria varia]
MTDIPCIARDRLRDYLLGDLTEFESAQIESHLQSCSDCEATVSALDRDSDTLVEGLRTPAVQPEPVSVYRLAAKRAAASWYDASDIAPSLTLPKLRDYELLEPLAHGGMGMVYRARHTRLNRQVAVKVLPDRWLQNPAVVARFEREMQAVGSLRHPAIVQATDGGEADGVHFLVMELIDGIDGSELVRTLGPIPVADACEIARQAAAGMAYVHEKGIVHRDLKPSNVMITNGGEVKILDLGLARVVGERLIDDELTTVGQLMGTLDYMAPEQIENSHDVDERADVYALGATLYKWLTGHSPHTIVGKEPLLSKLRRIATEAALPIASYRNDLPEELCQCIDGMLSKDASERPASMQEIAQSLSRWTVNCDLRSRVKEATKLREQHVRLPFSAESKNGAWPGETAELQPASPPQSRNRWGRFVASGWIWLAMATLLVAAGIVITLQMNSGQLVIETASPDVEVRILKSGETHRQLKLSQTAESLRLGAGEYDIEIVSDADGLEVENGQFTLKRGETWLAKIVQRDSATMAATPTSDSTSPAIASIDQPTYEGKTFDQWLRLMLQERSPGQFYEAVRAFHKLAVHEHSDEAVAAVLVASRYHEGDAEYKTASGETVSLLRTAQEFFDACNREVVINALSEELDNPTTANRSFIVNYLTYARIIYPLKNETLRSQLEQIVRDEMAAEELRFGTLRTYCRVSDREDRIKLLMPRLSDTDPAFQLYAASQLIQLEASLPEVVTVLKQLLTAAELAHRAEAAWLLGDVGSPAKSVVPDLVEIVQDTDELVTHAGVYGVRNPIDGNYEQTSVKDAAIRSLGEIGDTSVIPILIEAWREREFEIRSFVPRSRPETYRTSDLSEPKWIAYAIEKITDAKPNKMRDRNSPNGFEIAWSIRGVTLEEAYREAMMGGSRIPDKDLLDIVQRLMMYDTDYGKASAIQRISHVPKSPDTRSMDFKTELIELLAKHGNASAVLNALLARIGRTEATADIAEYQRTALQLWDSLAPDEKRASIIQLLANLFEYADNDHPIDFTPIRTWLAASEHEQRLLSDLKSASPHNGFFAVCALVFLDLTDTENLQRLKPQFERNLGTGERPDVLMYHLVLQLNRKPEIGSLILELLESPLMDRLSVFPPHIAPTVTPSFRAKCLSALKPVPSELRDPFQPLLNRLKENGVNGEAEAATSVLQNWADASKNP